MDTQSVAPEQSSTLETIRNMGKYYTLSEEKIYYFSLCEQFNVLDDVELFSKYYNRFINQISGQYLGGNIKNLTAVIFIKMSKQYDYCCVIKDVFQYLQLSPRNYHKILTKIQHAIPNAFPRDPNAVRRKIMKIIEKFGENTPLPAKIICIAKQISLDVIFQKTRPKIIAATSIAISIELNQDLMTKNHQNPLKPYQISTLLNVSQSTIYARMKYYYQNLQKEKDVYDSILDRIIEQSLTKIICENL